MKKSAQAHNAAEQLLEWFSLEFNLRIRRCEESPVLKRLDGILEGILEISTSAGVHNTFSAGTFKRYQIPNLLEHFGAEATQGVLLVCAEDGSSSNKRAYSLWFQNGTLIHAEGQELFGRAAVKACCQCQNGWYLFTGVPIPADIPASLPEGRGLTFLLLDILRQIDEEKHDTGPPYPTQQSLPTELPTVHLEPPDLAKLVRLVESVREGLLMQHRAELDAWYYRHGTEESRRYGELERRSLGRLYQWMAANGMMEMVNELQELPSTMARCEVLTTLLNRLSTVLDEPGDHSVSHPAETHSEDDGIDWSILEEDGSTL
jgi:hypothetical protein